MMLLVVTVLTVVMGMLVVMAVVVLSSWSLTVVSCSSGPENLFSYEYKMRYTRAGAL